MNPMDLASWIARQKSRSVTALEFAISATQLIRDRDVFGQTIKPAKGSVLASPVIADWNPEPDYFFHWVRDSAIAMRVVAELMSDAQHQIERERWRQHFNDFVHFSLEICNLRGADFFDRGDHERRTSPTYRKFLRRPAEIRALGDDDALLGEPRFNPDGTIDVLQWSRPQYDGPALRALACLRYLSAGGALTDELTSLLHRDLGFTLRHASEPCVGPWEEAEALTHHYYVALVQLGALVRGRNWLGDVMDDLNRAERLLRARLDSHWSEAHQVYAAVWPADAGRAATLIDASTSLAVLEADLPDGPHSVLDPRVQKTQQAIEALFAHELPINGTRLAGRAPAIGRYRGDRYFGGGAWYATTLAAAEFYFRVACFPQHDHAASIKRGDEFMSTVCDLTPDDGRLSEQVDRKTGRQRSARDLTWSYAAFVSAARRRDGAMNCFRLLQAKDRIDSACRTSGQRPGDVA